MTPNMRATKTWLRDNGFTCKGCASGDNLKGREILHFTGACVDCVMYLANGDLPEDWRSK